MWNFPVFSPQGGPEMKRSATAKRREYCLDLHWFATLADARSTIKDWRTH